MGWRGEWRAMIELREVSVRLGETLALDRVSLSVAPGEILGLVGASGSGKSTLAYAAMGLLPERAVLSGSVRVEGGDPAVMNALRGGAVGMVFQEPMTALNPAMTIGAQVAEAIRLHERVSRRAARRRAAEALARVGLDVPPGRFPHQLSGGQRQRVAIAIAIAARPRFLLADEPTTALDTVTQGAIVALLVRLVREERMGLLFVSHDLALVGGMADRIAVMEGGRIVEEGATSSVLRAPSHAATRRLLARALHRPAPRPDPVPGLPLLEVQGLTRRYTGGGGVEDVSFAIRPGEIVGLVGASGAGKTTILRNVLALEKPETGRVLLAGEDFHHARGSRLRALRRQVQAVFQDPAGSFDPRQTVGRIVAEPLHLVPSLAPAEVRSRVAAALARVGLDPGTAERLPHLFSGGQRQRIALARALVVEPQLLVLDEALSALDASTRADMLDLLSGLNVAMLFVSHDLALLRGFADRLLVLHEGRIVEEGATAEVLAHPRHPHSRALVDAMPDAGALPIPPEPALR
ncbi:nickel ABC transporter ATP-binding protein NikE [Sphingomonas aracearum]|uniref:ABC transporter ATP-binding protein n=1 Tax=Sphingomonas aracearum TaxID=2283317 RepID=A0A369VSA5_9SPHN|nr:ABC transporter ATP-binding protein [Sphingomonas aracearum]RDE05274.1 ABC transporter ATP-binding protein [Sphingomonas aracearum]